MKIYYYVHTGHRIGLDRFRRACAIINSLSNDYNITLLCSDFRIAHEARNFGIMNSVGIDVVRNIPQIANNGDKLIFDSAEANPLMLQDMRKYFSTFIRVSDDENDIKEPKEYLISPYLEGDGICKAVAVDEKFYTQHKKTTKISFFFGDDDYEKDLEKNLDFIADLEVSLGIGFYYFLDYEDMLKTKFASYYEFEDYESMIRESEILLTASPQAVLESLASGGKPIYFQREDYTKEFLTLFQKFGIPIVHDYDKNQLSVIIKTIDNQKYSQLEQYSNKISNFLKENLIL